MARKQLIENLSSQVPIANADGTPTPQFMRVIQKLAITGALSKDTAGAIQVGSGAVSLAMIQNIADKMILANNAGVSGPPLTLTISQILDFLGVTRGSIIYRGASGWTLLPPSTSGNILQTNGAGADPTWVTPAGGGGGASYEGFGNLLSIAGLTGIPGASANLTKTDGTKAHKFSWTASGSNTVQGATTTVPATPWNLYCRFIIGGALFSSNVQFGLIVRNSSSGKLILFAFNSNTNISVQNWTNPTTFASQTTVTANPQPIWWLKINNDGTNLNFYRGVNGIDWDLFSTQTLASFISSVDQIGLGGVPFAASQTWVSDFGFTTPV